jgi:hypothetical protein
LLFCRNFVEQIAGELGGIFREKLEARANLFRTDRLLGSSRKDGANQTDAP